MYKAWIFGRVLEFIGYVQHGTFCDLGKFKKEMEFKFKIFRNIFGEGKEYKIKERVITCHPSEFVLKIKFYFLDKMNFV